MKKISLITAIILLFLQFAGAQDDNLNAAGRLLSSDSKLVIGGYGQIDYNQPLESGKFNTGNLDVHRLVMLFGYNFSDRVKFVTEIEFEHVKEVYIEQAFLDYKINRFITLRGGLLLVPMGIINVYHEPPAFNGVERPLIDKYIVPSTWREIGLGITGNILDISTKYELYIMNGFSSFNGKGTLSGSSALRGGRQKGAESFVINPNIAGRIDYYGLRSLSFGLSGYFGKTQSTLYDGLDKEDDMLVSAADSSVVSVNMVGIDGRFNRNGWQAKAQLYIANLGNTGQYNAYTADGEALNDLGSGLLGYYVEGGYDLFHSWEKTETELILFARWERFNTHWKVEDGMEANEAYAKNIITTGLGWKVHPGAVFKADLQFVKADSQEEYSTMLNLGIGVWF